MAQNKPDEGSAGQTRAATYYELYGTECPTDEEAVKALALSTYDLKHRDVVAFDEDRDVGSQIAVSRENGTITLIRNPDHSCYGYLTIPRKVLTNVTGT